MKTSIFGLLALFLFFQGIFAIHRAHNFKEFVVGIVVWILFLIAMNDLRATIDNKKLKYLLSKIFGKK